MNSDDKLATARAMARKAIIENRPLEWFEELYQKADRSGEPIPWDDMAPNPNLLALYEPCKGLIPGPRTLTIGCGLGDDAEWLSAQGLNVTAFDVAPTAIAMCRKRFPDSKVNYAVADLFASPAKWNGIFNLVLESCTLQALPESLRPEAIRRIADYVAPRGCLLVITRVRHENEAKGTLPWPLLHSELGALKECGLQASFSEEMVDRSEPPIRRLRACYQRV